MEALWIGALAVFLLGYFALEGMVIGAGMLLLRFGRDDQGRGRIVSVIGRFFLASEIWLVAAIGVLFGAFPKLEGKILSGLYPVVVAFVIAWVLRSAGVWFRGHAASNRMRLLNDVLICGGSWVMATLWGVAIVAIWRGVPTQPVGGGTISPTESFAHPGAIAGAVVVAAAFAIHGSAFLAARLPALPRPPLSLRWTTLIAMAPIAALLVGVLPALERNIVPAETLAVLTSIAGPLLPLLILGQVWAWRSSWKVDHSGRSYF